jgi:hypothetical protein
MAMRIFWSALCNVAGSVSEIFERVASYALLKHLEALVVDDVDDCTRCAGTGFVGQVTILQEVGSPKLVPGDWTHQDHITECPSCDGVGWREYQTKETS